MKFDRRQFIEMAGLAGVCLLSPASVFAEPRRRGRVVVFVELNGGNDGLNTVIPFSDPLYKKLRPTLAIPRKEQRTLDLTTALHPSLQHTASAWDAGELAVVEGLGYADPNRSHFRSIEIWEGGTDADSYSDVGWVARAAPAGALAKYTPAALTVGGGGEGPLAGARSLELEEPERFFRMVERIERQETSTKNPALAHVLRAQNELLDAATTLRKHTDAAPTFKGLFKQNRQLRPLQLAAELIASGLPLLAVKIRAPGFDTHVNQGPKHARLLKVVDDGLGAFRAAMKSVGMWDDVVIVTYSEFGRRARENGGAGTDHGTAAAHLVMGGAVKGGRYGARPSLSKLDSNGDLAYTTDFRRLYRTLASDWWGFGSTEFKDFESLQIV